MTEVHVFCVGKMNERYYAEAIAEYKKRLSAFCRVIEHELKEEPTGDDSPAALSKSLAKEGEKLCEALPPRGLRIALCVEGKSLSSEQLASTLESHIPDGPVSFIIGSSCGLDESVKAACHLRLSFSAMTFPHRLMRVILYEQIYRSFCILSGKKYHK